MSDYGTSGPLRGLSDGLVVGIQGVFKVLAGAGSMSHET